MGPECLSLSPIMAELTGTNQLVALDESEKCARYTNRMPIVSLQVQARPLSTPVESRIEFQRTPRHNHVVTVGAQGRPGANSTTVNIERHETCGSRAGTSARGYFDHPVGPGPHPAVILVHASGAGDRQQILPFARFLVRHGVAVLGYDKRGVGTSTGDWRKASFEDLAGDVVAAFEYLKTRPIFGATRSVCSDGARRLGVRSPRTRAKDMAFLISIAGAASLPAETTIDQARNEMAANGVPPRTIDEIVELMRLQYAYLRSGEAWDKYLAARERIRGRIGRNPSDAFPATPDHPYLQTMRPFITYDPAPTLRAIQLPVLALFGEMDNNILAEKNKAAWEANLKAGGHSDYTMRILARANHALLEAKVGKMRR